MAALCTAFSLTGRAQWPHSVLVGYGEVVRIKLK
jgi:hypothetical protein